MIMMPIYTLLMNTQRVTQYLEINLSIEVEGATEERNGAGQEK
jgi:hypothetical protein